MSVPISDVLRALRAYPDGATTRVLAERLKLEPRALSSRLTKQFMWGGPVDRERLRGVPGRSMVWRAR